MTAKIIHIEDYREQRPLPRFVVKSPKSCDDLPLVGPVIREMLEHDNGAKK